MTATSVEAMHSIDELFDKIAVSFSFKSFPFLFFLNII
jgi:hypothetical protein